MTIRLTGALFIFTALCATPAWANLEIIMAQGCPQSVEDLTPQPDCPADAACRQRGQTVSWRRSDGGKEFRVIFHGAETQIFEDWGSNNCNGSANEGGQMICRIADTAPADDYKYDVEAEGCPLDPRLIIR